MLNSNPFDNPIFRLIITEFEIFTYNRRGKIDAIMFAVIQKMKYKYGVLEKRKIELMEELGSLWTWKVLRHEKEMETFLEESAKTSPQKNNILKMNEIMKELEKAEDRLDKLEQTAQDCNGRKIYVGSE